MTTKSLLPIVAIVGRPNVGKSSLFNRIIGSRKAIVESARGTTRDRLSAHVTWNGKHFTIVDTGGFQQANEGEIVALVVRQLRQAIKEADSIILVTDGAVGVVPGDEELATLLRTSAKRVFLAVNKIDDPSRTDAALDFFALGLGEPYAISAVNSLGVTKLLDDLAADMPSHVPARTGSRAIKVAIVGRPNVGKSSYVNALVREERVIVHPVAGTTRDAVDINFFYNNREYVLIDTAGIRHNTSLAAAADFYGTVRSKETIRRADVAIVLVDGYDGLREDDMRIIDFVIQEGKPLVIAVNKTDRVGAEGMRDYTELLSAKMNALRSVPIVFMSCTTHRNIERSLTYIAAAYEKTHAGIAPAELASLAEALSHAPELSSKRIVVSAIEQKKHMPPTFMVTLQCPSRLTDNIRRYIENRIRGTWDFAGVPIRITITEKNRRNRPRPQKPRKIRHRGWGRV